jgi:effector-binding domain-containing protein
LRKENGEKLMSIECKLTNQNPQPVLSIRSRSPAANIPNLMGYAFGTIIQYLAELGEAPAGMPFAAFYNLDTEDMDVEIGWPVGRELPGRGEIEASEIPGGWQASLFYTGRYDSMAPAYDALAEFVKANGYEPTGVAYEFYLNDPSELSPEEAQTMIMFPLKS